MMLLFVTGAAWAGIDKNPNEDAESSRAAGAGKKLGRGLANLLAGWVEIPKGIQSVGNENGFLAGITWGPIYGVGNALVRTGAGAYEVATFPVPVDGKYDPILEPEFPLQ